MPIQSYEGLGIDPATIPKRKPGRPVGSKDTRIRAPRPGSRTWLIANMQPGDVLLFERKEGGPVGALMQQIGTDIRRAGLGGKVLQTHLIAIQPTTRDVHDIVRLHYKEQA